ncbi:hypothetical protein GCK72_022971 [Caenorhabditis remanei]|uniref:Uncharacterized protein n=1 Tax=Caenorhabditis remanei TaxID=31234 RepID=A0A6A5FVH2_CAERE|nr:hypothetical protein GCK72_022971 [Caenorhabditis remanei]KAF1746515.1 hypothetical protein GCK72_022971 [Caenorhabditis remanei]
MSGSEPSKWLVTTLVHDRKVSGADIGRFLNANQQCFAVGVGRTVVLLDESKFSEIRRFDTSEMLQSVRFVRSNSQTENSNPLNATTSTAPQSLDSLFTVAYSGSVDLWKYNQADGSISKTELLDAEHSGEPPYHVSSCQGSFLVVDRRGNFFMWNSSDLSHPVLGNAGITKIRYVGMMNPSEYLILARTVNMGTRVKQYNLGGRAVERSFETAFNIVLPNVFKNTHMLIGSNTIMFASRDATVCTVLIGDNAGRMFLGQFRRSDSTGPVNYEIRCIGAERTRPTLLTALKHNLVFVATRNGAAGFVRVGMQHNKKYMHVRNIDECEKINDLVSVETDIESYLVAACGQENSGVVRVFKRSVRFEQHQSYHFPNIQRIFSVPQVLGSNENEFSDMLALSRKDDTRYIVHNGTQFETWDQGRPFSNLETIHLAYLVHHKCIVQVIPPGVIVFKYNDATNQWTQLCSYRSPIGTIKLADVDVVSGNIITCSGNEVSRVRFGQEQGKPAFREKRRKLDQSEIDYGKDSQEDSQEAGTKVVTCLALLSKDTVNYTASSEHVLLALEHSSTILVWNVRTLLSAMKFYTNICSPISITSWIDNFVVADRTGGLYRCSEYSVANQHQGTWKMISTRAAETFHNMNGFAITASTYPRIIFSKVGKLETQQLGLDHIFGAAAVRVKNHGVLYVLATDNNVNMGKLLNRAQTVNVDEKPEKLAFQKKTKTIAMVTSRRPENGTAIIRPHRLFILDAASCQQLTVLNLDHEEKFISITSGQFGRNQIEYFAMASILKCYTDEAQNRVSLFKFDVRSNTCKMTHYLIIPDAPKFLKFDRYNLFVLTADKKHTVSLTNGKLIFAATIDVTGEVAQEVASRPVQPNLVRAAISDDMITVVDANYEQDQCYLDSRFINETLKIGRDNLPRGSYWLGAVPTLLKSDKIIFDEQEMFFEEHIFASGEQLYFATGSGAIGSVLRLNARWSRMLHDLVNAARTQPLRGDLAILQQLNYERRGRSPSDYIDGDVLTSDMFSTPTMIRQIIDTIDDSVKMQWRNGSGKQPTNDYVIEWILRLREMFVFSEY